jgi:hypothetical protein
MEATEPGGVQVADEVGAEAASEASVLRRPM